MLHLRNPSYSLGIKKRHYKLDAFSIGHLRPDRPSLKATEEINLQCLISRSPFPETVLTDIIDSNRDMEKEARECYAKSIHYNWEEFVKILAIRWLVYYRLVPKIWLLEQMIQFLYHGLILLENQVLRMVLEEFVRHDQGS